MQHVYDYNDLPLYLSQSQSSGIGISIAANRYNHIRAALCNDIETTKLSRLHNDANILVLSGRSTDKNLAIDCINTFFNTKFEGGRHINRIKKLSLIHI